MLDCISNEEEGTVKALKGSRHNLQDKDVIILKEVVGMAGINGTKHTVKVINPETFKIGNTKQFSPYERNGVARLVKQTITQKHVPMREAIEKDPPYDKSLIEMDSDKIKMVPFIHNTLRAIDKFIILNNRSPKPWNVEDNAIIIKYVSDLMKVEDNTLIEIMASTYTGTFNPLASFVGGLVAQEAVKGMTQKYTPINQLMYYNSLEIAPKIVSKDTIQTERLLEDSDRYSRLRTCIGNTLLTKLQQSKIFVVGMGAIGCELLKNYSMCGIGTGKGGQIITTDPDVIETSNLNRQFLFREKHLRKPKSVTAAAVACTMNPELKGHITARLDKLCDDTMHIYSDKFYSELNAVTNALDNVEARRFIDMRCVANRTPLIESGTLGPKGHVQVVIPMKTESYRTGNDPQENVEIPHCTLKMFPEETLHCVEWARDKFGRLFTQNPESLTLALDKMSAVSSQEIKAAKDAIRMLKKKPENFSDCIAWARMKFQLYFVNNIKQLMYVYPLTAKTKDGRLFWTLPKRPPKELKFDPKNAVHASFIMSAACLRAKIFGITIPENPRSDEFKNACADKAALIKLSEYIPNESKASTISKQVEKVGEDSKETEEPQLDGEALLKELQQIVGSLKEYKKGAIIAKPEQFEKDFDANFHIDFIYAMANCRAQNYSLEEMSWINVKIKAGRIVAALATTTAVIAGLQTIELVKLIKSLTVAEHRNVFVNLALPLCQMSEPGIAPVTQLKEGLKVTLWDRWEVKAETLGDLLKILEQTYGLKPKDVMVGPIPVYLAAIMDKAEKKDEKEQLLKTKIKEVCDSQEGYIDMNVTFLKPGDDKKMLDNVPPVRVMLI